MIKVIDKVLANIPEARVAGLTRPSPPTRDRLLAWHTGQAKDNLRLDNFRFPGNFPIEMTGAKCATFDGTVGYVDCGVRADIVDEIDITISFNCASLAAEQQVFNRNWDSIGLRILATSGAFTFQCKTEAGYNGVLSSVAIVAGVDYTVRCIARLADSYMSVEVNGVKTEKFDVIGTALTNQSSNFVIGAGGNPGSSRWFNGKIWNTTVNGIHYPICEGAGVAIHSTSGASPAIATSVADIGAFWAGTQDVYFHEATNGYGKRINFNKYSNDISQSGWYTTSGCTITGTDTLTAGAGGNAYIRGSAYSVTAEESYTLSFEAMAVDVDRMKIRGYDIAGAAEFLLIEYTSSLVTGEWVKISQELIAPAGCTSMYAYPVFQSGINDVIKLRHIQFKPTYKIDEGDIDTGNYAENGARQSNLSDYPGQTWNNSSNLYAVKEEQVGTFDGVGDKISLGAIGTTQVFEYEFDCVWDVLPSLSGMIRTYVFRITSSVDFEAIGIFALATDNQIITTVHGSHGSGLCATGAIVEAGKPYNLRLTGDGSTYRVYVNGVLKNSGAYTDVDPGDIGAYIAGSQSTYKFPGKIWNANINGVKIPINEGSGTDIHDSLGNIVGTLTAADAGAFWANTLTPVKIALADTTDELFHTAATVKSKSVAPIGEDLWDPLAALFGGAGWVDNLDGTYTATATASSVYIANLATAFSTCEFVWEILECSAGYAVPKLRGSTGGILQRQTTPGVYRHIVTDTLGFSQTGIETSSFTGTIKIHSIREMASPIDANDQYFFGGDKLGVYSEPLTGADLTAAQTFFKV